VRVGCAALAEPVWCCLEGVPSPVGELVAVSLVRDTPPPLPRAPERWSQRAFLLETRLLFPRVWESLARDGASSRNGNGFWVLRDLLADPHPESRTRPGLERSLGFGFLRFVFRRPHVPVGALTRESVRAHAASFSIPHRRESEDPQLSVA
jgi:hypothetical protein